MRIALVIFRGEEGRGGAERYTADIAAGLARRGHSVDLISTSFGTKIDGVNFVPVVAKSPSKSRRYVKFLDGVDEHLVGNRYDIVHAMLPVRRCDLYHPHAGMAKAALVTHELRESQALRAMAKLANRLNRKRRLFAQVEEKLIYGADRPMVVCLSDYVKGMILRHYPDISGQMVKLFNGTDLGKFDPERHASARPVIRERLGIDREATVGLMIAQHFERKGLAEVIEACARIGEDSPMIVVVGKDDPARMRALAKRLGVESKIVFAGQTAAAADFYAAADFFVLPTRHDSCSLVVLEAVAMGLPVISTVFNGACEIMKEGEHGFVLEDPGDVGALAEAMGRMLGGAARQSMHQKCLSLREPLSFETHLDRLEEIYGRRIANRQVRQGRQEELGF